MKDIQTIKRGLNAFLECSKNEFRRTNSDNGYFGFLNHFYRLQEKNLRGLITQIDSGIYLPDNYSHYWAGSILFSEKAIILIEVYQSRLTNAKSLSSIVRANQMLNLCLEKLANEERERLGISN